MTALDVSVEPVLGVENNEMEFIPVIRSGAWSDIGIRTTMEDVFLCVDNFVRDGLNSLTDGPSAFYGVYFLLMCIDFYGFGSYYATYDDGVNVVLLLVFLSAHLVCFLSKLKGLF